jgi:uncharacterized membrane protein (UPF0127 family)
VALRTQALLFLCVLIAFAAACDAQPPPGEPASASPGAPLSVPLTLNGQKFHLELAAEPTARVRGLGGRTHIPEGSGMLFSFRDAEPRQFLMRDCFVPIDIAFLDAEGHVTSVHSMPVEQPRRAGESPLAYESRLPLYGSDAPAQFAVEAAGGALQAAGVRPGDVAEFDRAAVLRATR